MERGVAERGRCRAEKPGASLERRKPRGAWAGGAPLGAGSTRAAVCSSAAWAAHEDTGRPSNVPPMALRQDRSAALYAARMSASLSVAQAKFCEHG